MGHSVGGKLIGILEIRVNSDEILRDNHIHKISLINDADDSSKRRDCNKLTI